MKIMTNRIFAALIALLIVVLAVSTGCASKEKVRTMREKAEITDTLQEAGTQRGIGTLQESAQENIEDASGIVSEQELGIEEPAEEEYISGLEDSGIDDLQLEDIEGLITLEE